MELSNFKIITRSLFLVNCVSDDEFSSPHFDRRSRIFELDSCQGIAKVCLVYTDTKPGKIHVKC